MSSVSLHTLADILLTSLMHFVWQGAALALILLAIVKFLKVTSARSRYLLSVATLLLMGLAPLVTIALSLAGTQLTTHHAALPAFSSRAAVSEVGRGLIDNSNAGGQDGAMSLLSPSVEVSVLSLWLAGVVVLGARLLIGYGVTVWMRRDLQPLPARFEQRVLCLGERLRVNARGRVLACARVGQAVAVGFVRPVILIPTAWFSELPVEVLEAVIAHELAHIRRWDLWVNLAQRLIETFLFYHPAVWWLSRRIQLERELCCDELAFGLSDRATYARSLETVAKIAAGQLVLGASILGGRRMSLLRRIRFVLGAESVEPTGACWAVGLVAMILPFAAAMVLPLATAPVASVARADDRPQKVNRAIDAAGKPSVKESQTPAAAQDAKDRDLQIREIGRQFDVLMQAKKWDAAEILANDVAKKYGDRDAMIQFMLLQALNAKRQAQGLPVIRLDLLAGNANYNAADERVLRAYPIQDLPLWSRNGEHLYADILMKYLTTIDPPSWQSGESHAGYVSSQYTLIINAKTKTHDQIRAFLQSLRSTRKPGDDQPKAITPPKRTVPETKT